MIERLFGVLTAKESTSDFASNLMKIQNTERAVSGGNTFISPNPVRVREMLDKQGNVIDPRTKQIIRRVTEKE